MLSKAHYEGIMPEKITTQTIIETMKVWVENKQVIPPSKWIDAALKLNVLMGDDIDQLCELESEVARAKVMEIENGAKISEANVRTQAGDLYKQYRKKQAYVKGIEEFIRIAKKQATLRDNEMSSYS